MTDPIVITRELVKRGWTDFEPKVITGLLTGSIAGFLVSIAGQYGIHLTAMQQNEIAVGCYFLGSYFTPSSGTTVTRRVNGRTVQEQTSGPTMTTVTGPTPIQKPAPAPFFEPLPAPDEPVGYTPPTAGKFDHILNNIPLANSATAADTADNATQVIR